MLSYQAHTVEWQNRHNVLGWYRGLGFMVGGTWCRNICSSPYLGVGVRAGAGLGDGEYKVHVAA